MCAVRSIAWDVAWIHTSARSGSRSELLLISRAMSLGRHIVQSTCNGMAQCAPSGALRKSNSASRQTVADAEHEKAALRCRTAQPWLTRAEE